MNVFARAWRAAKDAWSGRYIKRTILDRPVTRLISLTPDTIISALEQCSSGFLKYLANIYDLMPATDLHLLGVRRQLRAGVTGIAMECEAVSDDPRAQTMADAVEKAIERPGASWPALINGITEGYLRGASLTEVFWEDPAVDANGQPIPGVRYWSGFKLVPQQRLRYDMDSGELLLITNPADQMAATPVSKFPPGKFVRCQVDEDVPDFALRGLYRTILPTWFGRLNVERWEQMAIERFGMPIPVGKYAGEQGREAMVSAMEGFGAAGMLVIDDASTVEWGSTNTQTGLVHETYMEKSAERISVAFLGASQTATIGKDAGSKASASIHEGIRRDVLYAIADLIAENIRRDLFIPFVRTNFGEEMVQFTPKLIAQFDEPLDLLTTAQAWSILSPMLPIPEKYARELTGIPAPGKSPDGAEEPTLTARPPAAPPAAPFPSGFPKAVAAAREKVPVPPTPPAFGQETRDQLKQLVDSAKSTGALTELPGRIRRAPAPILNKSADVLAAEMLQATMKGLLEARQARGGAA